MHLWKSPFVWLDIPKIKPLHHLAMCKNVIRTGRSCCYFCLYIFTNCRKLELSSAQRNRFPYWAILQSSFYKAFHSELKRTPRSYFCPRLPSSLPLLMRFPFLQNYKELKRTARTKALWKVVLLEVKRHCWCLSLHTVLMLWFVFFPLQWIMASFAQWLRQDDQGESRVKVPPEELR